MSLLRSICCMFGGRCAEEEPKPSTETMHEKHLVILVRGRPSEKEPAKTNFDAWRPAQLELPGKAPTRLLNFSSTCRLVNFPFECTQRGAEPLLRDIPIHNLLAKD